MRLIIEVDNADELERALAALEADAFKDQPIQVTTPNRTPSRQERQAILERIYSRYRIELPPDWTFDRDAAHER